MDVAGVDRLGNDVVNAVFADGNGDVCAATYGGLSILINGGARFGDYTTLNGLGSNIVSGVWADGTGTVYAATDGGLGGSNDAGTSFTNKDTTDALADFTVSGVYAVGSNVYVSTQGGGLSVSTDGAATFIDKTTADGLCTRPERHVLHQHASPLRRRTRPRTTRSEIGCDPPDRLEPHTAATCVISGEPRSATAV